MASEGRCVDGAVAVFEQAVGGVGRQPDPIFGFAEGEAKRAGGSAIAAGGGVGQVNDAANFDPKVENESRAVSRECRAAGVS